MIHHDWNFCRTMEPTGTHSTSVPLTGLKKMLYSGTPLFACISYVFVPASFSASAATAGSTFTFAAPKPFVAGAAGTAAATGGGTSGVL